jgi:hypothetical protein
MNEAHSEKYHCFDMITISRKKNLPTKQASQYVSIVLVPNNTTAISLKAQLAKRKVSAKPPALPEPSAFGRKSRRC